MRTTRCVTAVLFVLAGRPALSQDSTSTSAPLPSDSTVLRAATIKPVIIHVTRGLGATSLEAPFAMTVIRPDSARPGQRHTALDETLSLVPGVTAINRTNPSQDPRISIRGFGARSTFGVRGVRVLRDGMPLTLPDGQTPVDYLSLESVDRLEVIRGAASALYGNASGGVIDLRTIDPPSSRLEGEVRQLVGDFGLYRTTVKAGGTSGRAYYQGDASFTRSGGFRIYSRQRTTSGFARIGSIIGGTDYSIEALGLNMPLAENPGALTRAQFETNPRNADQPSVTKQARKEVRQLQIGLTASRQLARDAFSANVFAGGRSLYNPLTFAVVDVGRRTYGASARATHVTTMSKRETRFTGGFDLQSQNDSRLNFSNCNFAPPITTPTASCPTPGQEKGTRTLDQREVVSGAGLFITNETEIAPRLRASAGLRADNVKFEVQDHLIAANNPDDSGDRTLHALTPYIGLVARLDADRSLYANIASAFETPTATELGNHPDGSAGINQDLKPQKSTTYEIGFKGFAGSGGWFDVAGFITKARDELVPFEIPASNGRRYFRNAGRTTRRGAELGVSAPFGLLSASASYTYSDFRFDKYATGSAVFDGRRIPGIPIHRGQLSLTARRNSIFAVAEGEFASKSFVDDANSARSPGYGVMNLRAGVDKLFGVAPLSLVAGAQNVLDRAYAASVSVNAAQGKFFEPAPRRTAYISITLRSHD